MEEYLMVPRAEIPDQHTARAMRRTAYFRAIGSLIDIWPAHGSTPEERVGRAWARVGDHLRSAMGIAVEEAETNGDTGPRR